MSKLSKNLLLILFAAVLIAPSAYALATLRQFCDEIRDDKRQLVEQIESAFPDLLDDPKGLEECLYWAIRTLNQEVVETMLSEHRRPMLDHQLRRADALFEMMRFNLRDARVLAVGNRLTRALNRGGFLVEDRKWPEVARVLIQELKRIRHEADDTHMYVKADFIRLLDHEARNGAISTEQLEWFLHHGINEDDQELVSVLIRHPRLADALPGELRFAYMLDRTEIIRLFQIYRVLPAQQMRGILDDIGARVGEFHRQPDWTCPTLGVAAAVPALISLFFWYTSIR